MPITRREMLLLAAALGAVPLSGCERAVSEITERMGERIPDHLSELYNADIDFFFHLLSRAGFGPWPGEVAAARKMGLEAWLEQQLHPEQIDDAACEWRARRFETIHLDPGTCYEYKKNVLRDELVRYKLVRAIYSKRQLFEAMVDFWTDHLNINIEKTDCIYLKAADDRLVVRPNALGKFRDLIRASATSAAMLVYLDGNENRKANASGIPNENYARELLELHTLGVHGGYTQHDVFEVARCLTGWHIHTPWQRGKVYFDGKLHDDGEKHVLGQRIPAGGGPSDLDRVVAIACAHPSTATHIARKLVTRFVADDPPESLISSVSQAFHGSDGDIKTTLKAVFTSDEFAAHRGNKLKRPFQFLVSCLRATGADSYVHQSVGEYLTRMGHGPFQYPTPDGYPEKADHWVSSLLWRWNFAIALTSGRIQSTTVSLPALATAVGAKAMDGKEATNAFFSHFTGRTPNVDELQALLPAAVNSATAAIDSERLVGLIMASPAFQRC